MLEGLKSKLGAGVQVGYAQGVQIARTFPSFFDQIFRLPPVKKWSADEAKQEMDNAVTLAKGSDLTVLVLGEAQNMSGEAASRESLDLPGEEEQLLEAVAATGKPVVVVLMNGRPLNISWASQHVPAILEAWYPGTQGGNAVANLLFGDAVPGGKAADHVAARMWVSCRRSTRTIRRRLRRIRTSGIGMRRARRSIRLGMG